MDVEQIFQIASAIKSRREELTTVETEIRTLEQEMQKLVLANGSGKKAITSHFGGRDLQGTPDLGQVAIEIAKGFTHRRAALLKAQKKSRSKPGESVREKVIAFLNAHTSALFTPKQLADAVGVANIQTVHASIHDAVKRREITRITHKSHSSAYGAKKYAGSKLYTKVFCSLVNKHSGAVPFTEIFASAGGDGVSPQAVHAVLAGMLRYKKIKQVGNSSYQLID